MTRVLIGVLFIGWLAPGTILGQAAVPVNSAARLKVYLWTMLPGKEIAGRWGHNALRLHDPSSGFDQIYNWGTYDFDQPGFYRNFVTGRLLYTMAVSSPEISLQSYQELGRGIIQNQLNLSAPEIRKLISLINQNLEQPEYLYHYRLDNCSSRVRDYLDQATGGALSKWQQQKTELTFRHFVRDRLQDYPPLMVGLDIMLTSNLDRHLTRWELAAIPEHLKEYLPSVRPDLIGPDQILSTGSFKASGAWWSGYELLIVIHLLLALTVLLQRSPRFNRAVVVYGASLQTLICLLMLAAWMLTEHEDFYGNVLLLAFWPAEIMLWRRLGLGRTLPLGALGVKIGMMTLLAAGAAFGVVAQAVTGPILVFFPLVAVTMITAVGQQRTVLPIGTLTSDGI